MKRRPRKCCEILHAEDEECGDKISSLPDEVLGYILSFLPTECAVGTSILSTRWRCLHMLTNSLSFDAPDAHVEDQMKIQKKSFKKFVNRVLLFHKVSPIKKFHLNFIEHIYDDSQLHAWISAAVMKGVEQLHLSFLNEMSSIHINALPHCLFSCQTIVELKIYSRVEGFRVPESIHLPILKILHLKRITVLDRVSFRKLFNACPLLQELEIENCSWPMDSYRHLPITSKELKHLAITYCQGRIEVDAPNLEYLKYFCRFGVALALSLKNPGSLVTADLSFSFIDSSDLIQHGLALIKAVSHVKELLLTDSAVQYLTRSEDDHVPSFGNLVEFELGLCSYDAWKYIAQWLAKSPRLETLIFGQGLIKANSSEEKWPSNVALIPFTSRVKVIEVYRFRGYTTEIVLLRYLLKHTKVLKKLILYYDGNYQRTFKQRFQASKKLLMLPRASKNCVVQWRKSELLNLF